jgi:thiamine biosynthesis protein ThiS
MRITLNNRDETFDRDTMTINQLLEVKNYTFKLLVTKINGKLIRKDERDNAVVRDGDDVTVLHMISGG